MKKNIFPFVSIALVAAGMLASSGCSGLFLWEKGRYYQSEAMDSATVAGKDIKTIGVYVFSNGEAIEHTMAMGLGLFDWPSQVLPDATFEPDTSNAGPSLELATDLAKELKERGYSAKAVTDLGHSGEITVEQCLKNAKDQNLDGAVVVYYSAVKNWKEDMGTTGYVQTIMNHNGFLYIPNGGFFEVKTGDEIWKNSYYGLVENAHLPNFWNEPFVKVAEKAMVNQDAETYIDASPKAVAILLDPPLFPGTTKAFPSRGEKKQHRM